MIQGLNCAETLPSKDGTFGAVAADWLNVDKFAGRIGVDAVGGVVPHAL